MPRSVSYGQDDGAVPPVVRLALLGDPTPVAAAVVEGGPPQNVPAAGGELDVADHDTGVPVEIASGAVEVGPAPVVGDVDAGQPVVRQLVVGQLVVGQPVAGPPPRGAGAHASSRAVRPGISVTSW